MRRSVFLLVFVVLLLGCVRASDRTAPDPPPPPEDRGEIMEKLGVSVSVAVPPDAWSWIATHANRIGIKTTTPIEVLDESKNGVVVHTGTEISASVSEDAALIEFSGEHLPTASKKIGPLPVRTSIKSLMLKPDGGGIAKTSLGQWPFSWRQSAMGGEAAPCECGCGKSGCQCSGTAPLAAAGTPLPSPIEVTMETPVDSNGNRFCGPCKVAEKAALESRVPLPFKLKVVEVPENKRPQYPYFSWKSPSGKEWQSSGFTGGLAQLSYAVLSTVE